jgi:hypothetical protein
MSQKLPITIIKVLEGCKWGNPRGTKKDVQLSTFILLAVEDFNKLLKDLKLEMVAET